MHKRDLVRDARARARRVRRVSASFWRNTRPMKPTVLLAEDQRQQIGALVALARVPVGGAGPQ